MTLRLVYVSPDLCISWLAKILTIYYLSQLIRKAWKNSRLNQCVVSRYGQKKATRDYSRTTFLFFSLRVTQVSCDDGCPHLCGPTRVCELKVSHLILLTFQTDAQLINGPINLAVLVISTVHVVSTVLVKNSFDRFNMAGLSMSILHLVLIFYYKIPNQCVFAVFMVLFVILLNFLRWKLPKFPQHIAPSGIRILNKKKAGFLKAVFFFNFF